jgi:hypothetical protein
MAAAARMAGLFRETVEDVDQLVQPFRSFDFALFDALGHTLLDVRLQDGKADPVQGGLGGRELLQDLDAKAWFLHHPPDTAHLSFNAVQTSDQCLLLGAIQHAG